MRRPLVAVTLLAFLLGCVSIPIFAQKITGDIAGDVTDASGAVMPNVTVTAENLDTHATRTVTTNSSGNYRITDLAVGTYKVSADAQGFKTTVRQVGVAANALTHADFKLQVGQRNEQVTVEAVAPLVDMTANQNSYVDEARIQSVPLNGRDFNSLLAITPGVQRTPGGGFLAVSINGSRTTSNNYLIDGLYNNDRYYGDSALGETGVVGIPASLFPMEAIQELNVQENPSAEFGVKGGAPINMVMKSGTNAFHGDARFFRHTDFADAAAYFLKHQQGGCPPTAIDNCRTPMRNFQFGGTIGGPIIKDRTFFFAYYEAQRYKSQTPSSNFVPTPADIATARSNIATAGLTTTQPGEALLALFPTDPSGQIGTLVPTTSRVDNFGIKIDHKISSNHLLTGRYLFGDSLQSAPTLGQPVPPAPNPATMFNTLAPTRVQLVGLSWTWNISNNKILESRLGMTRFSQILTPANKVDPQKLGLNTGPLDPADFGIPYLYFSYFSSLGGVVGYPLTTAPTQTYDWSEHLSWIHGNHALKMGGNFQHAYTSSLRNRARSEFDFDAGTTVGELEQLLLFKPDGASRSFGNTFRHIYEHSFGFYFSDDWKVTPRFTMTMGLRWDYDGPISESSNTGANFIPGQGLVQLGHGINSLYTADKNNFGPRFGFAWDVFGDGKTALRGGYSLTYDVPTFAAIAAPYTFAGSKAGAFTQPNLGVFPVSLGGDLGADPTDPAATCLDPNNPNVPANYICLPPGGASIFGSGSGQPPFNIYSVVRRLHTPRTLNMNLSIQREMFKNNVLTVAYSGSRGYDLLVPIDINAVPLGNLDCATDPFYPAGGTAFPPGGPSGTDLNFLSGTCQQFRPFNAAFPQFHHIIQTTNLAQSQYDSLQVSYRQRDWHGINTQYNYTFAKCFDQNSVNRGGAGDYPQINNPANANNAYGLCDHDVRHNFNLGGTYDMPSVHSLGRMGTGWEIATIYTAISGRPTSAVITSFDPSGQGLFGTGAIRASWDGTPVQYNTRNPDQYVIETFTNGGSDPCGRVGNFPLSPFFIPCPGTVGTSRRNMVIGPGLSQWDMSLIKNTKLTERLNLQFRWEVFNILNRANFSPAISFNNNIRSSKFGVITSTPDVDVANPVIAQGGPRNMQFMLKVTF